MKRYAVNELFATLQGEGAHAGTPAVFVRFAGCNLWSGHDVHRQRDAARNAAACPRWCDTDFRRGEQLDADTLVAGILGTSSAPPLIVFTGGEPTLQLDEALLERVHAALPLATLAIETNGTSPLPRGLDWVCVSPKTAPQRVVVRQADEVKVVSSIDPAPWLTAIDAKHYWISAQAQPLEVGKSLLDHEAMRRAARYCMENPPWKLTLQMHKIVGLR